MKYVWLFTCVGIALLMLNNRSDAQSLSAKLEAENPASLVKAAQQQGNAVRGAILFAQQKLGCANCHSPGAQDLLGPDLTRLSEDATYADLVEAMLSPSKKISNGFEISTMTTVDGKIYSGRIITQTPEKFVLRDTSSKRRLITLLREDIDEIIIDKKSAMPDDLVDQLTDRGQFLDLLKYLMELKASASHRELSNNVPRRKGRPLDVTLQGLVYLDEYQCVACHRNDLAKSPIPKKRSPLLAWGSGRMNPNYIERFIANPLQVKPGTMMPDVMASLDSQSRKEAAREITHYLASLGKESFQTQPLDAAAAERGSELFHTVGCVACHSPRNQVGEELLKKSSVSLGMLNQKYNLDGLAAFLENPHQVRPSGRMPNMQLSHWEAVDIANYLLSRSDKNKAPETIFQLDIALAKKGRQQFHQLGCDRCHESNTTPSETNYPSLSKVNSERGCLSGQVGSWPRFLLDDAKLKSIRAAIERPSRELTDQEQISLTLATFKCFACHQRGDLGGVSPQRNEHFKTTNPNLGPQARIPPRLTDIGAKLRPKWMRQVLVSGRVIRPYIKTRMPQYGADNVAHLVDLFQRVDQAPEVKFEEFSDKKLMRNTGHQLAGSSGLNCIACHTFQQKRAAAMSAVDLTEMAERLHKKWFFHYMQDPQRFSTNTIMPSFWPGGRAMRKDILEGNANGQIEAIWQYLLDGRQARTPRGLIREPIELVAKDEAVMLRRSYSGIGKRGIGVGYPGRINLAFDAEQLRMAIIWKGKFADPGGVFRGQGSGTVRPLSRDLFRFVAGPEFDDAKKPWVVDEGRPPQHQFKGYFLDDLQRPTFMYRFDNIDIEDYPIDVKNEKTDSVFIKRTLTFESQLGRKNVAFRVAEDPEIISEDRNTFLIGNKLQIRIDEDHVGKIIEISSGKRLFIPLDIAKGKSKLVIEYAW